MLQELQTEKAIGINSPLIYGALTRFFRSIMLVWWFKKRNRKEVKK